MFKIDIKWMRFSAIMLNAVLAKGLLIAGAYFGGSWLDRQWGTEPYCTLALILLAACLGLTWIVFVAMRFKW